jgi:hypothetical protein
MRDRLRAVQCPADITDQIGGLDDRWCRAGVWVRLSGGGTEGMDEEDLAVWLFTASSHKMIYKSANGSLYL